MLQFDPENTARSRSRCPASPQSVIVQFERSQQKVNQASKQASSATRPTASNRQEHLPGAHLVIGRRITIQSLLLVQDQNLFFEAPCSVSSRCEPVQQEQDSCRQHRAVLHSLRPGPDVPPPPKSLPFLLLSRQRYHRQNSQDDSQYCQASAALSLVSLADASITIVSAVSLHPVRASNII